MTRGCHLCQSCLFLPQCIQWKGAYRCNGDVYRLFRSKVLFPEIWHENWLNTITDLYDSPMYNIDSYGLSQIYKWMLDFRVLRPGLDIQCESKKSPVEVIWHCSFFHKRLRTWEFLIDLYTPTILPICARLQIFIQLSPTLTKLCHIKRDYIQGGPKNCAKIFWLRLTLSKLRSPILLDECCSQQARQHRRDEMTAYRGVWPREQ